MAGSGGGWNYVSGRVAVLESRLLPRQVFVDLTRARSMAEASEILARTSLKDAFAGTRDVDAAVSSWIGHSIEDLRRGVPDVVAFGLLEVERAMRRVRATWHESPNDPGPTLGAIAAVRKQLGVRPDVGAEATRAFAEAVPGRPGRAALALDAVHIELLLALGARSGSRLIASYLVDLARIGTAEMLLRSERRADAGEVVQLVLSGRLGAQVRAGDPLRTALSLLPPGVRDPVERAPEGERTNALAAAGEAHLEGLLAVMRRQVFGVDKIFAYVADLMRQARNLRRALSAVVNDLDRDEVEPLLEPRHV